MITVAKNIEFLPVFPANYNELNSSENEEVRSILELKQGVFEVSFYSMNLKKQDYLDLAYYNITNRLYLHFMYDDESNVEFLFNKTDYNNICVIRDAKKSICYLEIFKNENVISLYGNITYSFDAKELTLKMLKEIGINKLIGERAFRKFDNYDNMRVRTEFLWIDLK